MPCKEEEDEFKFLSRWKDYVDDIKGITDYYIYDFEELIQE